MTGFQRLYYFRMHKITHSVGCRIFIHSKNNTSMQDEKCSFNCAFSIWSDAPPGIQCPRLSTEAVACGFRLFSVDMDLIEWLWWYLCPKITFKTVQEFPTVSLDFTLIYFMCIVSISHRNSILFLQIQNHLFYQVYKCHVSKKWIVKFPQGAVPFNNTSFKNNTNKWMIRKISRHNISTSNIQTDQAPQTQESKLAYFFVYC